MSLAKYDMHKSLIFLHRALGNHGANWKQTYKLTLRRQQWSLQCRSSYISKPDYLVLVKDPPF